MAHPASPRRRKWLPRAADGLGQAVSACGADHRAIAAVEFAVVLPVLLTILANVLDVASYTYNRLEVENAAQMGVQAAWRACGQQSMLPATTNPNCKSLDSVITAAVQATSLGTRASFSRSENYYCITPGNALQKVGPVTGTPPNCSGTGMPIRPGDYIEVQVTFTYTPLFPAFSIASLLPTPIVRTARMRLG